MRLGKRNQHNSNNNSSNRFPSSSASTSTTERDNSAEQKPIYYFGYGSLVNPIARQRRGVNTDEAHAALLPNYRLTFSCAGSANIVPAKGWEVYGVVMKCNSMEDWNLLKDFDTGYECIETDVFPLKARDSDAGSDEESIALEEEGFAQVQDTPIRARVFVLPPQDIQTTVDTHQQQPQQAPLERYLKVIASGMTAYGVDPEYIQDQILGVPFIPSRTPEDYGVFPPATTPTPTLTLAAWNKEYEKRNHSKSKGNRSKKNLNTRSTTCILFRIGTHAIQVQGASHDNPFCVWLKGLIQGPQDSTWMVVQTCFDPDLPLIASPEEVTQVHQTWAENILYEKCQQANLEATLLYNIDTSTGTPERSRLRAALHSSWTAFRRSDLNLVKEVRSNSEELYQHEEEPQPPPPPQQQRSTHSPKPWTKLTSSLRHKLVPTLKPNTTSSNEAHSHNSSGGSQRRRSFLISKLPSRRERPHSNNNTKDPLQQSTTSWDGGEGSPLYDIHAKLIEPSSDHFCCVQSNDGDGCLPLCLHQHHQSPLWGDRQDLAAPPIHNLVFDSSETNCLDLPTDVTAVVSGDDFDCDQDDVDLCCH